MKTVPRVLLASADAARALAVLEQAGFTTHVVRTAGALQQALARSAWDALTALDDLAGLAPSQVLALARASACNLPVVVVTSVSLVEARTLLDAGADDVILPEHLARLPLAVTRAIRQAGAHSAAANLGHVFTSSQAIMLLMDSKGALLDANPAAAAFYGRDVDALRQLDITDILALPAESALEALQQAAREPSKLRGIKHRQANGELRDVEVQLSPMELDGRHVLHAIVQDVTDRTARERELQAISLAATALRDASHLDEMLPILLQLVRGLLGVQAAAVALRDPDSGETLIECAHGWLESAGARLARGQGVSGRVVETRLLYWSADEPSSAAIPMSAVAHGLAEVAGVPMVAQQQAIGALCVGSTSALTRAQLGLLEAIGSQTASAVQRAMLDAQTEQRLRRLDALHAIDVAITSSFDLRVTLNIFLDHLADQLRVDAAAVLLLNPLAQSLEYAAVHNMNTLLARAAPLRLGESIAGRVAVQRQSIYIPDLRQAERDGKPAALPALVGNAFNAYYGLPLIAKGRVQGVLEVYQRAAMRIDGDWVEFLNALSTQAAIAIDNAHLFLELQRSNLELNLAYDATIEGWARVLEARGMEPAGHALRVTDLALRMGRSAGLSEGELVHMRRGSLLHDIGMLRVPEAVVLQPGRLSEADRALLERHPEQGAELLGPIGYLRPALDIPLYHHERWDGSGYPHGLRGNLIPLPARLFALADVWDALRSQRPYRPAWPDDQARAYVREQAGKLFDPQLVHLLLTNGSAA